MNKPRVRFAPSPTGYLHIGGARTALFNWLWARKTGGTFVLRIEDTDQERSTEASTKVIIDSMRWLGLDWDEGPEVGGPYGPYFQMQRLARYAEHANRLVSEGKAYRCYATREEIDALRQKLPEKKRDGFVYPHLWRDKTEADWIPGAPYVIRFKTPLTGTTEFVDKVFGSIKTANASIEDFVIMRSDGVPLYNFGAVVDDVTMDITLVARGSDHIINTPKQILLYQAVGGAVPEFAHLPMMLSPAGRKLSKRVGDEQGVDVPVEKYQQNGWLPDALLNYIARFGWSAGDQEIFSRDELIEKFDWAHCGTGDGRYDKKKALWVSGEHIKRLADDDFAAKVYPFLAGAGVTVAADDPRLIPAARTVKTRSARLIDAAEAMAFYFQDAITLDPAAVEKFLTDEARANLRAMADVLDALPDFTEAGIGAAIEAWLAERGFDIKTVAQPARVALTGRTASPGLYEVIAVLGRDVSVRRLRSAAGA
ncbi:MAG: glutamate--tRNA ligase [Deltaproteobacteria bacterium]|nr:glutamate--tRNA ligase [Deltaproteobacteria bacterium]MBK8694134.1 glutamate--tRNA ligase [Deltaproteobacteria bacterium]MBP6831775.1 glutamate--tRNA ligase [Deltaproteobacteria bacterium]